MKAMGFVLACLFLSYGTTQCLQLSFTVVHSLPTTPINPLKFQLFIWGVVEQGGHVAYFLRLESHGSIRGKDTTLLWLNLRTMGQFTKTQYFLPSNLLLGKLRHITSGNYRRARESPT